MSQVISQSIKAPKIIRTGMPEIEEYIIPPFPKWVDGPNGRVLVQDAAEELAAKAAKEKADGNALLAKASADAAAAKAAG